MIGWTSPTHIVLLLLIALLLFGAKRLPEIGRSLGHGMREFKDSVSHLGTDDHEQRMDTPTPQLPIAVEELPVVVEEPALLTPAQSEHEREVA
jgi:sec-independent protein translocase protein TatA